MVVFEVSRQNTNRGWIRRGKNKDWKAYEDFWIQIAHFIYLQVDLVEFGNCQRCLSLSYLIMEAKHFGSQAAESKWAPLGKLCIERSWRNSHSKCQSIPYTPNTTDLLQLS